MTKIARVLRWVMVLIITAYAGVVRAEEATSEPTAATGADPGASAQEKQPSAKSEPASRDATLYPVPNYAGDIWSRSYLTGY